MKTLLSCEFNMDAGCVELRYSDGSRLAMLTSQGTDQLLLLGELQISFGILHVFFGKDGCKFLLEIASIQAGEG